MKKLRRLNFLFIFLAASGFWLTAGTSTAWAADINKLLRDAMKFYEKGNYDKAMKQFIKVLERDPDQSMAREYMMLCSQKIVEQKLGTPTSETVEKQVAVEKQIQEMGLENKTSTPTANTYDYEEIITTAPAMGLNAVIAALPAQPNEATDIMAQRDNVSEELRRRNLGIGNIVELSESGGQIEATFYMNRLFLPYSEVLRDEAFPVLNHVIARIKAMPQRKVAFKAVDLPSAQIQSAMPELSNRRCITLFSYLLYSTYRPDTENILASAATPNPK